MLSIPLGGALIDPRDDATLHPSLTVGLPHDVALGAAGGLKGLRLESRSASFGDLLILLHCASAHPDRTHYLAFSHQRDSPREYH